MIRPRGSGWWLALALAAAPTLVACGADEDSAGAVTEAVRVTDVEVGTAIGPDRRVVGDADGFSPNDTIYVSVATDGAGSNATLTARWTYQDGQVVDETSQSLSLTGPANTEFHISMPNGLPTGTYTVEILLNGQSVDRETFEIEQ